MPKHGETVVTTKQSKVCFVVYGGRGKIDTHTHRVCIMHVCIISRCGLLETMVLWYGTHIQEGLSLNQISFL